MDEEKCAQRGAPASPGTKLCESCGAPLTAASQPVEGPAMARPAPSSVPSAEMPYQGVDIRFAAFLIDAIVWGIISSILTLVLLSGISVDVSTGTVWFVGDAWYARIDAWGAGIALTFVIVLFYFTLLLGHYGQSVGMMLVKIKVVKEIDHSPITYGAAFLRTILLLIDAMPFVVPCLLGAILIWDSDKKQRLGDRVARTIVVKAR